MDKEKERKRLQDWIEGLEKDNKRLVDRHGDGVRLSWVSTDIAMNSKWIRDAKEKIRQLDDDWSGGYGKGPI
jgi:hypothetical protein